jgi:hypothetical protein
MKKGFNDCDITNCITVRDLVINIRDCYQIDRQRDRERGERERDRQTDS